MSLHSFASRVFVWTQAVARLALLAATVGLSSQITLAESGVGDPRFRGRNNGQLGPASLGSLPVSNQGFRSNHVGGLFGNSLGFGSAGFTSPLAQLTMSQADLVRAHSQANMNNARATIDLMKSRKLKLEGDWQQIEVDELGRQTWFLRQDEWKARKVAKSLGERAKQLTAFFNGRLNSENCQAFQWAARHIPYSASIRNYVSTDVPPLDGLDFRSQLDMFSVLNPDCSLKPVPPALCSEDPEHPIEQARVRFAKHWSKLLDCLTEEQPISFERLRDLDASWTAWDKVATQRRQSLPIQGQSAGRQYLRSVRHMVRSLHSPARINLLRRIRHRGGFAFRGGPAGQLLGHVQAIRLSVNNGSRAQLVLSEVGERFLRAVHAEIAAKRQEIDKLIARSPAENAATREAIINGSYLENAAPQSYPSQTRAPTNGYSPATYGDADMNSPSWLRWARSVPRESGFAKPVIAVTKPQVESQLLPRPARLVVK